MSSARPVPMTDGSPPRHRLRRRLASRPAVRVAAGGIAIGVVGLVALQAPGSDPDSSDSAAANRAAAGATAAPPRSTGPPASSAADVGASSSSSSPPPPARDPTVDPAEPTPPTIGDATTATLPPRARDVRLDPDALAARFVAEWLTYPPGGEPAATLAARLSELITWRYRTVVAGLSTAGTEDRPGSQAVMGATTRIAEDADDAADDATSGVVYRVTAWQAPYQPSGPPVGPDSWDVTLVRDPAGGWLVDGLRRVG
ncbi:MAG: hypothetical protein ACRD29_20775 [Acidimicrobiales bacterium]